MIEALLAARVEAWATAPVPDGHRRAAAACLDDFLACVALGARDAPLAAPLRAAAPGGRLDPRTRPEDWALFAGAVAHGLEWDDSLVRSVVHPAVAIVPAALARAIERGTTVDRLLRAIGAGYDVIGYLGEAGGHVLYDRWLHPTAQIGPFGAAAAIAVLDEDVHAFLPLCGLAPSLASGSMAFLQSGAWTKGLQVGWGNVVALRAVALLDACPRVPELPFTGRGGLGEALGIEAWPDALWERGTAYVEEIVHKPYPSCRLTHGAIEAGLELGAGEAGVVEAARAIRLRLSPRAAAIVGAPDEAKRAADALVERQFSAHYAVAAGLLGEDIVNEAFLTSPGRSLRPRLRALAGLVTAVPDADVGLDGAHVELAFEGRTVQARVDVPRGDPTRPLDAAARATKWAIAAGPGSAAVAEGVDALVGDGDAPAGRLLQTVAAA